MNVKLYFYYIISKYELSIYFYVMILLYDYLINPQKT